MRLLPSKRMFKMKRRLRKSVAELKRAWNESPYYADAETKTFIFWDADRQFRPFFDKLDTTSVVELAVGHGRHAERAAPLCKSLMLMDVVENNLEVCRSRLKAFDNIQYILGDGVSFRPAPDESQTAIYCYDAMVHFDPDIVASYLHDAKRILRPDGMALFHHSNYVSPVEQHYRHNPHARNNMSQTEFRRLAAHAGLDVVESKIIPWGGCDNLDCITLCRA